MTVVLLNGKLVDARDAWVPALDRALTHGLGLYETIKLAGGVPVFFEEHLDRLESGLSNVGFAAPFTRRELAAQAVALSTASGVSDGACRLLVTAGPPDGSPAVLLQAEVRTFPAEPLRLISYHMLRAAAALKSNSFIASHVAQRAAKDAGADDAVFVDEEGRLYEASTANVFCARDGVITTAPNNGAILPGVIRARVMQLAAADGLRVVEGHATLAGLTGDDALLLTSSVRGIVAARSLDGRRLRLDEPLLERLRGLVGEAERASSAAFTARYA
jgi:branched-subunit amino acid aminotransferase/4-amino-4-deoxychorismate lyase